MVAWYKLGCWKVYKDLRKFPGFGASQCSNITLQIDSCCFLTWWNRIILSNYFGLYNIFILKHKYCNARLHRIWYWAMLNTRSTAVCNEHSAICRIIAWVNTVVHISTYVHWVKTRMSNNLIVSGLIDTFTSSRMYYVAIFESRSEKTLWAFVNLSCDCNRTVTAARKPLGTIPEPLRPVQISNNYVGSKAVRMPNRGSRTVPCRSLVSL
jgi:hypothetical protein